MLSFKTNRFPEVDNRRYPNVVKTSVVTFSTIIQLIKKLTPLVCVQLRTLFHFYCLISGARSLVTNDLNFMT